MGNQAQLQQIWKSLGFQKVCVFGMGRSGLSALALLQRLGAQTYAVNEGDPEAWKEREKVWGLIEKNHCFNESQAQEIFGQSDLIILSPGIPRTHPSLNLARQKQIPLWSEIELACRFVKLPTLVITGTNGKTTTTALVGELLNGAGRPCFVGGNIGTPFCEFVLKKDEHAKMRYVVLELSSFQLESIVEFHPQVGVILNITPGHGERYKSVDEYRLAKFKLTQNMGPQETLVCPSDDPAIFSWSQKQKVQKKYFTKAHVRRDLAQKVDLARIQLKGEHNLLNVQAALLGIEALGVPVEEVLPALYEFKGLAHRIEAVPTPGLPFKVFNDSKSTNFQATITAVQAMEEETGELWLILGGKLRGENDSLLAYVDFLKAKVNKVLLVGESTELHFKELAPHLNCEKAYTLKQAVELAKHGLGQGVLLFSPAFPSFDQFQNYVHRGESFKSLF